MKLLKDIYEGALDLLFPRLCNGCGERLDEGENFICAECSRKIKRLSGALCKKCGTVIEQGDKCYNCRKTRYHFNSARSIFYYNDVVKEMIQKLKYNARTEMADYFADRIVEFISDSKESGDCKLYNDVRYIMAVALHPGRLRYRGFNQSALIAERVAEKLDMIYLEGNLRRVRNTPSQTGMNFKMRAENVRDAFEVYNPHEIVGAKIILIDDVYTTGATSSECAKVLKDAGCAVVHVITPCRSVLEDNSPGDVV